MEEVYLVELGDDYLGGRYKYIHFATLDKEIAKAYVEKYNRVVGKLKKFYATKDRESDTDEALIWWEKNYHWSQKMDARIITLKLK